MENRPEQPPDLVRRFAAEFAHAWPTGDPSVLARFFADDAVYCNGPLPPVTGRSAILESLAQMMELGGTVTVDFRHLVTAGRVVLTERVDGWVSDNGTATLRVAGVFEVDGGVITAWRDYFDLGEFSAQVARPGT